MAETLIGTDGADSIENYGSSVTIDAGAGNDRISLGSGADYNVIKYTSGDGNDTIYGFDGNDTLSIAGGSYSTTKSGNDVIVTVGDGKISLIGAASLSSVNIVFTETGNPLLIKGTEGADSISNSLAGATINASNGEDTIENYYGGNGTLIDAGNDKDYISNSGNAVTINGGAGDDVIENNWNASDVSIAGGTGNDSVVGFNWDDILQIGDGTGTYSKDTVGSDILISVGSGVITLSGAANLPKVNIKGRKESLVIYNENENSLVAGSANADVVLNAANDVTVIWAAQAMISLRLTAKPPTLIFTAKQAMIRSKPVIAQKFYSTAATARTHSFTITVTATTLSRASTITTCFK